jgi:hypothetical protein
MSGCARRGMRRRRCNGRCRMSCSKSSCAVRIRRIERWQHDRGIAGQCPLCRAQRTRADVRTGWAVTLREDNILPTKLLLDCLHAISPHLSMLFDQPRCESRPITTFQGNYGDRDAMKRIVREHAQSFMDHPYQISAGNSLPCHPNAPKSRTLTWTYWPLSRGLSNEGTKT